MNDWRRYLSYCLWITIGTKLTLFYDKLIVRFNAIAQVLEKEETNLILVSNYK